MARRSWVVIGCWLALGTGCDRQAPVEAGADPAAEQPSTAVVAKDPSAAGGSHEGTPAANASAATEPAKAASPGAGEAKAPAAPPTAASEAKPAAPAPAPAPMSREDPELHMLPAPPTSYTLYAEAPLRQGPRPKLVVRSAKRNMVIDEEAWFTRNGLVLPLFDIAPRPRPSRPVRGPLGITRKPGPAVPAPALGSAGDPLPPEVPTSLHGGVLIEAIHAPGRSIAIYEHGDYRRHRMVVRDEAGEVLGALDFTAYAHVPGDGGRSRQEIEWAWVEDGVLFVSTRHLGYASGSGGLNAFITAIELGSAQLLWRSEPLVSNSHTFLVRDGWIITGYGFTAEPDFLFVLDGKTGEVVQRLPVKSGPEHILEKDGVIHVRTYDHDYLVAVATK